MTNLTTYLFAITLALGSTLTLADEIRVKDWTGLYTGIAIGATSNSASPDTQVEYSGYFTDVAASSDRAQLDPILQNEIEGDGVSASLLAGYHFQTGSVVYGLEADLTFIDYSESESDGPTAYDTLSTASFTTTTKVEANYMISLRPKIGYVKDTFLMHLSAGPVISEFTTTHDYTDTYGIGNSLKFEDKEKSVGLSVNIGIDYRIASDLSLRADYTHMQFSKILDGNSDVNRDGNSDITYDSDLTSNNFRLALIKQF